LLTWWPSERRPEVDDREQQRKVKHRLAVIRHAQEVTGNVAATCRYYGISRQCFYKWLRRYEELGEEGLRDGSSAPLSSPNATKPEVVSRIVYLRSHYHFGPHKVLRAYPRCDQKTAIQFLDDLLERLPFKVQLIQTDNGAEFQGSFHWHLLDRGIGHVYIRPATPRLNGKVERSHRIDEEESYRLLEGVVIDDTNLFNEKLQEWEDFYNFSRPHGGLGGHTPYERLRSKATTRVAT
jgi:transposase-like protein